MKVYLFFSVAVFTAIISTFSCSSDDSGGNNNISTCGGKEYDTTVYSCEKGEIVGSCRGNSYYPEYQYCDNNGEIKNGTEISSSSLSSTRNSSSSNGGGQDGGSSSSDGSSGSQNYDYCLTETASFKACFKNYPADCNNIGQRLSNSCPYENCMEYEYTDEGLLNAKICEGTSWGSSSSSSSSTGCTATNNTATHYCSNGTMKEYGILTDSRDNQTYKTVVIGEQTWMAENLNYAVAGSKCYGEGSGFYDYVYDEKNGVIEEVWIEEFSNDEIQANCAKYGHLYNWSRGVCPIGWHLPSHAEWSTLIIHVEFYNGCSDCAGTKLKATSGWNDYDGISGNGTDAYGFSALPGGLGLSVGGFSNVGYYGYWWSSSENISNFAYYRYMTYSSGVNADWNSTSKSSLFSVRCVQD